MHYCSNCGTQVPDNSKYCPSCGNAQSNQVNTPSPMNSPSYGGPAYEPHNNFPPNVENHLVKAILVTLFCCLPFGIAAIVSASQVSTKLSVGDIQGAMEASKKANDWANIALGIGITIGVIYFLITVFAIGSSSRY